MKIKHLIIFIIFSGSCLLPPKQTKSTKPLQQPTSSPLDNISGNILSSGETIGSPGGMVINVILQIHPIPPVLIEDGQYIRFEPRSVPDSINSKILQCQADIVETIKNMLKSSSQGSLSVVEEGLSRTESSKIGHFAPTKGTSPPEFADFLLRRMEQISIFGFEDIQDNMASSMTSQEFYNAALIKFDPIKIDDPQYYDKLKEIEEKINNYKYLSILFDLRVKLIRSMRALETAISVASDRTDKSVVLIIGAAHWDDIKNVMKQQKYHNYKILIISYPCRGI